MAFEIFVTIFLVLLNGFFVATEFAIVKVRSSELELKTSNNKRLSIISKHIIGHLDSYLAATQLGITIASIGLGLIGEDVVQKMIMALFEFLNMEIEIETAHQIAFPIAYFFITFLHVVFGELAPKSIAIRYPFLVTVTVAYPLRFFYFIFRPFIWLFNGCANLILSLMGIRSLGHEKDEYSESEYKLLLKEGSQSGSIKKTKYDLLEKVFNFDDKMVSEIMVPRMHIFAIDMEAPDGEIYKRVIEEGYSRIPVYKDSIDNIIGLLNTKDLLRLLIDGEKEDISEIVRPPYVIPFSKRVGDLLLDFQRTHNQIAIITDEYGGTAGLVTMEDIIEELLGEIYDEYDEKNDSGMLKMGESEYILNALTTISKLNEVLPNPIPEDNKRYSTLSGFLLHLAGRIPHLNESFVFNDYKFTILQRSNLRVEMVQLSLNNANEVENNQKEKGK